MSLKPLVSVIIASYNHQNYITDCIKSVIKQSYKSIELIVIDDGSTDDSIEILIALAEKYQFQFIRQKNMGLTQTLNKALSLSKGEYIAPLGSDDCWLLDKIEKQVEFMQQHPDIAVVAGNILVFDQNGKIRPRQRIYPQRYINFERLFNDPKSIPAAPTVMIRTAILKKMGGYDTQSNLEDLNLWLRITKAGFMMVILNDVLAYYRKHPTNTSKNYQFMTENILKASVKAICIFCH